MAKQLSREILQVLHERTGKKISTLRSQVSRLRQDKPTLTSNAAAHLIARRHNTSVLQKLDSEDKASLNGVTDSSQGAAAPASRSVPKPAKRSRANRKLFDYETSDYFIRAHVTELEKAYAAGCYTCVFILFRKIVENLIIGVLKAKYPDQRDLYWDSEKARYHDFSVVLSNLYSARADFDPDAAKAIERLHQIIKPFKKDANDKTHSWFHVVKTPDEVASLKLEQAIELIKLIESGTGIR